MRAARAQTWSSKEGAIEGPMIAAAHAWTRRRVGRRDPRGNRPEDAGCNVRRGGEEAITARGGGRGKEAGKEGGREGTSRGAAVVAFGAWCSRVSGSFPASLFLSHVVFPTLFLGSLFFSTFSFCGLAALKQRGRNNRRRQCTGGREAERERGNETRGPGAKGWPRNAGDGVHGGREGGPKRRRKETQE